MNKLLFFTENYERGGGNRYLYDMVCLANKPNQEIIVFSNYYALDSVEKEWFQELGIQCKEISIFTWGELRTKFKLRNNYTKKLISRLFFIPLSLFVRIYQLIIFFKVIKSQKPDLIIGANGGYPAGSAVNRFIFISWLLDIRCFYSVVNIPTTTFWDKLRMCLWDRIIPKIAGKIIVDSEEIKNQLVLHGFSENKITILYNGLKSTLDYKPRNNLKVKILYFARMEEIKGVEYLLNAIQIILNSHKTSVEFHFFGDGTLASSVKNLAQEFKENVFFHGFYEGNYQHIFTDTDIYILPSLMEGLPYTILEAMRAGCCIIASEVGGLPELIENNISGILIKPKNIDMIVETIIMLLTNKNLREELGRSAKHKFDNEFEQTAIFKKHSKLFNLD